MCVRLLKKNSCSQISVLHADTSLCHDRKERANTFLTFSRTYEPPAVVAPCVEQSRRANQLGTQELMEERRRHDVETTRMSDIRSEQRRQKERARQSSTVRMSAHPTPPTMVLTESSYLPKLRRRVIV